jgi:hypothetical protein
MQFLASEVVPRRFTGTFCLKRLLCSMCVTVWYAEVPFVDGDLCRLALNQIKDLTEMFIPLNLSMSIWLGLFQGVTCETNINECTSDPCWNNGQCQDKVNGYLCNCRPGFNGKNFHAFPEGVVLEMITCQVLGKYRAPVTSGLEFDSRSDSFLIWLSLMAPVCSYVTLQIAQYCLEPIISKSMLGFCFIVRITNDIDIYRFTDSPRKSTSPQINGCKILKWCAKTFTVNHDISQL